MPIAEINSAAFSLEIGEFCESAHAQLAFFEFFEI